MLERFQNFYQLLWMQTVVKLHMKLHLLISHQKFLKMAAVPECPIKTLTVIDYRIFTLKGEVSLETPMGQNTNCGTKYKLHLSYLCSCCYSGEHRAKGSDPD